MSFSGTKPLQISCGRVEAKAESESTAVKSQAVEAALLCRASFTTASRRRVAEGVDFEERGWNSDLNLFNPLNSFTRESPSVEFSVFGSTVLLHQRLVLRGL